MTNISYYSGMFIVLVLCAAMIVVSYRAATGPDECKSKGYSGYVVVGASYECSNGEVNNGCIITESGVACGDVTFTKIRK